MKRERERRKQRDGARLELLLVVKVEGFKARD